MAYTKPEDIERARRLRRNETAAEERLWAQLRGRRLNGLKFVRQLPIGPYFADFACREKKLIVEADGVTHSTDAEIAHDAARTAYLENQGYMVLRAWNTEIFTNPDGVLESILLAVATR